jgi:hypothetical protein
VEHFGWPPGALGHCYRYDFKAASYSLMTAYAQGIDPNLKTTAITEYVRDRSAIRKRIARDIGVREDQVKTVLTAIGFGAQLKDNRYSAIRKELGSESYNRLLANTEFTLIKEQLDAVRKTITADLGTGDFEIGGMVCTAVDPKDGTKRTKSQKLAWLYQRLETFAMEQFLKRIPADHKLLLIVHDCVYLDRPIPSAQLVDIKHQLSEMFPTLDVEGEHVIPIHVRGYVPQSVRVAQDAEAEHRARIAAEQQKAMLYVSPLNAALPATCSTPPPAPLAPLHSVFWWD